METEESRALERAAQYYEDRSNLYVGADADALLDLADESRSGAERIREQHHQHLAQRVGATADAERADERAGECLAAALAESGVTEHATSRAAECRERNLVDEDDDRLGL